MNEKLERTLKRGVLNNKSYTLNPIECKLKLNQNESPFDLPEALKSEIIERVFSSKWNVYPDFTPSSIYRKAADYLGVSEKAVLLGNGSNEMIFTILAATIEEGKKVVLIEPVFTVYKLISSNLNADIKTLLANSDDMSINIDEVCREAAALGSVTILCSPNNPTGALLTREQIEQVVKSSGGIVVVDEAYIQFGGETVIDLTEKYENLLVLRTFSKAFGLAGMRIGMMAGNEVLIEQMSKVKLPYNLDLFTLTVLDVVLSNLELYEKRVEIMLEDRDSLKEELKAFSRLKLYETAANFFLVKVEGSSKGLFDELVKESILIRDVSKYPLLENHLRISVGSREENAELIRALKKILN